MTVLGYSATLQVYVGSGATTWANKMNFGMNNAPGEGSIA